MKYGGGRYPNNNWRDRHLNINPGDYIHVSYYEWSGVEIEQEPSEKTFKVLEKKTQFPDDDWVLWKLQEVRTGKIYEEYRLNSLTQILDEVTGEKRASLKKLEQNEIDHLTSNPFYTVEPIPPPVHPDDFVFPEPNKKYPKPASLKKFNDPKAGQTWKNSEMGKGGYEIVIEQVELWGLDLPKAVTYRTVQEPEMLHRKPLEWFKRIFRKG